MRLTERGHVVFFGLSLFCSGIGFATAVLRPEPFTIGCGVFSVAASVVYITAMAVTARDE